MRTRGKVDNNQREITDGLNDIGIPYIDLSGAGGGIPDICVAWHGDWYMIEIKNPKKKGHKNEFTDAQRKFYEKFKEHGTVYVAYTLEAILDLIGL